MLIPLTLVWFGALEPQDRAPNLGVGLEIKWEQFTKRIFGKLSSKTDLEVEFNQIFYIKESENLFFPEGVCSERNI